MNLNKSLLPEKIKIVRVHSCERSVKITGKDEHTLVDDNFMLVITKPDTKSECSEVRVLTQSLADLLSHCSKILNSVTAWKF